MLANLPTPQSELILISTLSKAWLHPDRIQSLNRQGLGWLLSLAYAEGLPTKTLHRVLNNPWNDPNGLFL